MSNAFITKAFASTATGASRILLLALSDSADEEGKCHPGQRYLRVKTALSMSAIRSATKSLIKDGHITCHRRFDSSNKYIVHPIIDQDAWIVLTEKLNWDEKNELLDKVGEKQSSIKKSKSKSDQALVIQNLDHSNNSDVIQNPDHCDIYCESERSKSKITVIQNPDINPQLTKTNPSLIPKEGDSSESTPSPFKKKSVSKGEEIEVKKPKEVNQLIWKDYLAVRKSKKGGVFTETALDMTIEDAARASITLEDALKHCIKQGWVGFNAQWYINSKKSFSNVVKPRLSSSLPPSAFRANNFGDEPL